MRRLNGRSCISGRCRGCRRARTPRPGSPWRQRPRPKGPPAAPRSARTRWSGRWCLETRPPCRPPATFSRRYPSPRRSASPPRNRRRPRTTRLHLERWDNFYSARQTLRQLNELGSISRGWSLYKATSWCEKNPYQNSKEKNFSLFRFIYLQGQLIPVHI